MQNNVMELYYVFDLVIPGCLGVATVRGVCVVCTAYEYSSAPFCIVQSFKEVVADPIDRAQEKRRDTMSAAEHRRIIAVGDKARTAMRLGPLALHMLRRLKTTELADQLPHKEEVCVYVPLTTLQARIYERFLASVDVRTLLGNSNAGDPSGPLWRMNRPEDEILPVNFETRRIALLGWVC